MRSPHPGDLVLALLARGGTERLREIIIRASELPSPIRERVLAQIGVLSGLRRLSGKFTMEVKTMGITVDIDKHVFLREIRQAALAEGKAEGIAEGKAEGKAEGIAEGKAEGIAEGAAKGKLEVLEYLLENRFGAVPAWAKARLDRATPAQIERWVKKAITAETLEGVIGRR